MLLQLRCALCCRDVVHKCTPCFTQSGIILKDTNGKGRQVVHHLLPDPPVFQFLAAAVPLLLHLPGECDEDIQQRLNIAVIGAGAGTLPAVLAHVHSQATVDAVDVDDGVSSISLARYEQLKYTSDKHVALMLSY